jgi:hypothetical protein
MGNQEWKIQTLATLGTGRIHTKSNGQARVDNPETLATLGTGRIQTKQNRQSRVDNPETLATLETGRIQAKQNGQSSDTGDIGNRTNTNKRKKHNTTQHRKLKW